MIKRQVDAKRGVAYFLDSIEIVLRQTGMAHNIESAIANIIDLYLGLAHGTLPSNPKPIMADPERKWFHLYDFEHGVFVGRYSASSEHVVLLEINFHPDLIEAMKQKLAA